MIRRRRWVQPEFFSSEDVNAIPRDARLTFIGLWAFADDFGRARMNPALIKASVWPLDDEITTEVIEEHLLAMADRDMVSLYAVDGREYLELPGWEHHQPVDKPSKSRIPPPPDSLACPEPDTPLCEPSRDSRETRASEGGERGEGDERESGTGGAYERETQPTTPPSPFCRSHPGGTDKPCTRCGNARMAFKHWQATHQQSTDDKDAAA